MKKYLIVVCVLAVAMLGLTLVQCGSSDNDSVTGTSCSECRCQCSGGTATVSLYNGKPLECPSGCPAFCTGEGLGSYISGSCAD